MPKLVRRGFLAAVIALFALVAISAATGAVMRPAEVHGATDSSTVLLGNQAVGAGRNDLRAGRVEAFRFGARRSGVAGVVHVYVGPANNARVVTVGIYSDAGGEPGSLLSMGSASSLSRHAWSAVALTPARLTAGETYWLAVLGEGGTLRYRTGRHSACSSNPAARSDRRRLPKRWSARAARGRRARGHCPISAYVASVDSGQSSTRSSAPRPSSAAAPVPAGPVLPAAEPPPAPPPAAPISTAAPAINGSAVESQTLTATTGAWSGSPTSYAYQWEDCSALLGCMPVSGANSPSYVLTASDVEHAIRVVVTATNAGGSTPATSAATASVLPRAPTDEAPPVVRGKAEEGELLEASDGRWISPTSQSSYAYQWEDCNKTAEECHDIGGATSSSYRLTASDVGHTVLVVVTASNAGGSTLAISKPTVVIVAKLAAPTNEEAPRISGSALVNEQLDASTGAWTGSPTSYAYQWEDCNKSGEECQDILGATSPSYRLAEEDVEHTVRVAVEASNPTGTSLPASSEATAIVVAKSPAPPANEAPPVISGSAVEGQKLTASTGTWSGAPTSYAYKWQDCSVAGVGCSTIAGATSSSYSLAGRDVGHTIRVVVRASNAGGSSAPASSQATSTVVPPAPRNTVLPAISGLAVEGDRLEASTGSWSNGPTSYAYQWEACNSAGEECSNIGGAITPSFELTASDVAHTIRVVVTASNAGGATPASSQATAAVAVKPPAPPASEAPPVISGSAVEGQKLTASAGTWSGAPTSYAYQWQDCNAAGEDCSDIAGATTSSYKLTASDVADTIRVVVKASNGAGSTSASSAQTASVAKAGGQPTDCFSMPSSCGYPDLTNTGPEQGVTLTAESGVVTFKNEEYINANGEKKTGAYEDKKLEGEIYICPNAKNVTIKNDEVSGSGGREPSGQLIRLEAPESIASVGCNGETHDAGPESVTIAHVSMHGNGPKEPEVVGECLRSWKTVDLHVEYDSASDCDGMKINGGGYIEHDYCLDNAEFMINHGEEEHYECISDDGTSSSSEPTVFKNDTFFNTHDQTAAIFLQGYAGGLGEIREEENLLAGGDYSLYGGNEDSASEGNVIVRGNRFARCASKACPDAHGYFADGGYYGPVYPSDWPGVSGPQTTAKTTWEDNYWDDNLEAVPAP